MSQYRYRCDSIGDIFLLIVKKIAYNFNKKFRKWYRRCIYEQKNDNLYQYFYN